MLLINKLKLQDSFSETEIVIANYILNNLKDVCEMNISTLASNTFCSVATISRFCKKTGAKDFPHFKVELSSELYSADNNASNRVGYDFPFNPNDDKEHIAETITMLSRQTLNDSYKTINLETIYTAAKLLDSATQVSIYANGNSLVPAMDLHNKLLWIGKNSSLELISGFHNLKSEVKITSHVAVLISYYGTNAVNIEIAKRLKETNTPYILITGPKLNPLCVNAELVIQVPPIEDFQNKIAPMASRISMTYVCDLLYSILFSFNYEKNTNKLTLH